MKSLIILLLCGVLFLLGYDLYSRLTSIHTTEDDVIELLPLIIIIFLIFLLI